MEIDAPSSYLERKSHAPAKVRGLKLELDPPWVMARKIERVLQDFDFNKKEKN